MTKTTEKPVSSAQLSFIRRLCEDRTIALSGEFKHLLTLKSDTSREASALINALKKVPTNPVDLTQVDPIEQGRIDTLEQAVPSMSGRDAAFALSLVRQFRDRGRLSEKQWAYVDRLAQPAVAPSCDPQPGDIVQTGTDLFYIVASKAGRPYAKRMVGGKWTYESGAMSTARQGSILTGEALAEWASAYGKAHGFCMFCSLELTDQRSVDAGYGPTCANKYDLPWGVSI